MSKNGLLAALLAPLGLAVAVMASGEARATNAPLAVAFAERGASQTAAVTLVVSATGNEARYRIRELLAGMELPYDAVGKTSAISGSIALDATGKVIPAQSRIVIDVKGLTSDKERRDGFVQRRLLETEQHPTVVLSPTSVRGLPWPLPASGARSFDLIGNLTVKGVTRPTSWRVNAQFQGSRVTGKAATRFTFADFQLEQPKVPVVLSLADTIALEYDFNMTRQTRATR